MQDIKQGDSLNSLYSGPDEKLVQLEDIFSNQQQSYQLEEFCILLNEKIEYLQQKISRLTAALEQPGMPLLVHTDLLPNYVRKLIEDLQKMLLTRGFKFDSNTKDSYKNAQQALLNANVLFAIISKIELTELLIALFKNSVGTHDDRFKKLRSVTDAFSLRMSEFKDTPSSPGFRDRTSSSFSSPLIPRSLTFGESSTPSPPKKPDPELHAAVGTHVYLSRVREERQLAKIQLYKASGLSIPEDLQLLAQQCRFTRELRETENRLDSVEEVKLLSELSGLVNQLRKAKQEATRNPHKEQIRAAEFKLLQKHSAWLQLRCEQGKTNLENVMSRPRTFSERISFSTPKLRSEETLAVGSAVDQLRAEKRTVDAQLSKLKYEILGSELMRPRIKRTNHLRLEIQSLTYLNTYSLSHKNVFENLISQKVKEKDAIDKDIGEALPGYQGSDGEESAPHESRIAYIKKLFLNSVRTIEALETETGRLRQIVARSSIRLLSGVLLQTLNINLQRVGGVTTDISGSITYWTQAMAIIPRFQNKLQVLLGSLRGFITDDLNWLKLSAPLAVLWARESEAAALMQSMAERESYYEKALADLASQLQQEEAALRAIAKQIHHACEHQTPVTEIKFSIDPENDYKRLYQQVSEFDEKPEKLEAQMQDSLRLLERHSLKKSEALVFLIANGVQSLTLPAETKSPLFQHWREFCVEKLLDSEFSGMNFPTMKTHTTSYIRQLSSLNIVLSAPVFRNLRETFLKDITDITAEAPFITHEDYFMAMLKDFQGQFAQLLRDLGPARKEKLSDEKCRENIKYFLRYLQGEEINVRYPLPPLIPPQGALGDIWVNKNVQHIFDRHFKTSNKKSIETTVAELVSDSMKVLLWRILLKFADSIAKNFEEKLPIQKILESTVEYRRRLTEFHLRVADFRNNTLKAYLLKTPADLEVPLFNCVKWLRDMVSKPELLSPEDFDNFLQRGDFPQRHSAFLDRVHRSYAGRLYVVLGKVRENWSDSRLVIEEFQENLRNKIEQIPENSWQWVVITAKLIENEIQLQHADASAREKQAEEAAKIENSQRLESHRAEQKKLSEVLILHSSRPEENPGDTKNGQFAQLSTLCRISTRQQAAQTLLQMAREWRDIQSAAIVEIKIQGYAIKLIRDEKELEGLASAGKKIYVQWDAKAGDYHYHYYVNWNGIPEKKELKAKTAHRDIEDAVKNTSRNTFNFSPSCMDDVTAVIFRAEKHALEQKMQKSGSLDLDLSKVPLQVDENFRISMKRLQKANGYLDRITAVNKKLALPEFPQPGADISPELPESLFMTTVVTEKEASEQLAEAQAALKTVFDPLLNTAGPLRECFHQYRKFTVQEKLLLALKEDSKQGNPLTTERFVLENHRAKLNDVAREIARLLAAEKINVDMLKKFNINCDLLEPSDTQLADFLVNYCQSQPYAWYESVAKVSVALNNGFLTALIRLAGGILYGEVTGKESAFPITEYKYCPVITRIFPESESKELLAGLENTQWAKRLAALENLHRIISAIPEPRFSEVLNHLEILHKDLVSGAWRRKRVESPQEKAKKAEVLNIDLLTNTQQLIENAIGPKGLEMIDRLGVQDWDIYKSMSPHISTLWSWKFDEECAAAFQTLYQHFVYLLDLHLNISDDYTQPEPIIRLLSILENLRTSQNVNVKVAWSEEVDMEKLNSGTECAVKDSKSTPRLDKFPDLLKLKTDPVNFNKILREKLIGAGVLAKNIPLWEEVWDKLTKKAIIHNGQQVAKVTDLKEITQNLDELLRSQDDQKNHQNLFAQIKPQLQEYVSFLKNIINCCDGVSSGESIVTLRRQKGVIAELLKQCFIDFNFTASSSTNDEDDQAVVKDFQRLEQWLIAEQKKFNDSLATPELVTLPLPALSVEEEEIPQSTSLPSTPESENHFQTQIDRGRISRHEQLKQKVIRLEKENEELKKLSRHSNNTGNGSPFPDDCDQHSDTSIERKSERSFRSTSESPTSLRPRKNSPDQKKLVQEPSTTLSVKLRLFGDAITEAKKHLNELLATRELLQTLAQTAAEKAPLVNILPGLSLVPNNRSVLDLCTQLSEIFQQKLKHSVGLEKQSEELSKTVLRLKTASASDEPGPEFLVPWMESKIKNGQEKIKDLDKLIVELNDRYHILVEEAKQKASLGQSIEKNSDESRRQAENILKNLETKYIAKETYQKTLKKQEKALPPKAPLAVKLKQDIQNITNELTALKKQIEVQKAFIHTCAQSENSPDSEEKSKKTEEQLKELRQKIIDYARTRADQEYDVQQLSELLLTKASSSVAPVLPPLPALPEDIKYEWKPSASVHDRQSQLSEQNTKELCLELQKQLVENTKILAAVQDQCYGLKEWILKDVQGEVQSLLGQKEEMEYLSTDSPEYRQWETRVQLLMARLQTPLAPAAGAAEYQQWQQQIQGLVTRLHPEFKDVDFQEEKLFVLEAKKVIVNESLRNNYTKLVKEKALLEAEVARLQVEQKQLTDFLSKTPDRRRQENLNAINPLVFYDARIRLKNRCFFWNLKAKIVEEQLKGYAFQEIVYLKVYSVYDGFRQFGDKIDPNRQDLSQTESEYMLMTFKYANLISRYDELKIYALENAEALKKLEQNELPQRRGNWYNLKYLAISAEIKDDKLVKEIEKHDPKFKTPILLKHGDNIKLWGYDGEWRVTLLDLSVFSSCRLNFTGTCQLWSRENIHPNVLKEIQLKKAHTCPADTEKTILKEHGDLLSRASAVNVFAGDSTVNTMNNESSIMSSWYDGTLD
jgi:hypothetical protein